MLIVYKDDLRWRPRLFRGAPDGNNHVCVIVSCNPVSTICIPGLYATAYRTKGRYRKIFAWTVDDDDNVLPHFSRADNALSNVVKVRIALIEFLPLYVVFIIWKGWKYVGVEERNLGLFMIMATVSILGSAYLISFLLNALI